MGDDNHRAVQDDGVHLLHEGPHQREDKGNGHQKPVRLHEGPDVPEKSE